MCNEIVETINYSTASQFIDALSRLRPDFASDAPGGWIFRGHADDEKYKLVPNALRNGSAKARKLSGMRITKTSNQIKAECAVLANFFRTADGSGLSIPEDTQQLRFDFKNLELDLKNERPVLWPPNNLLSLMALAQHHGVPTRLLDWSRNPLKAALFAAHSASEFKNKSGLLSVWGFWRENHDASIFDGSNRRFSVVTAPGATNVNLRAQEGVFMLAPPIEYNESRVNRLPFDEMLRRWLKENLVRLNGPWFRRVTLPKVEAENLCFKLAFEGITWASLFPDFYGVVRAMEDWARWSRFGGPVWNNVTRPGASFLMKGFDTHPTGLGRHSGQS